MTKASAVPTAPSATTDAIARSPGSSSGSVARATGNVSTAAPEMDTNDVCIEVSRP